MLYIHIGLPKTGTTFLQEEVFPKWKGVQYYGKNKQFQYKKLNLNHMITLNNHEKFLISDEDLSNPRAFNPTMLYVNNYEMKELAIYNLSRMFPDAKIMISFRRHHSWIESLYKHTFKHGLMYSNLNEYFDIEKNEGDIKKEDICYRFYVDIIEKYFNTKPFVFLQEELKYDLDNLLEDMECFLGEKAPVMSNKITQKNKGIGNSQAKLLSSLNKIIPADGNSDSLIHSNKYTLYAGRIIRGIIQNRLSFIPSSSIKMNEDQREATENYYKEDWEFILNYIYECPYRTKFNYFKYE